MILFPNCKINLGLSVTGRRDDGFHNLETVFYPIYLKDALEIITRTGAKEEFELIVTGITVPGDNNLCKKAWELLKKDFPSLPPVKMHLHKAIPIGAGLGGGSSDGAFALMLLNNKLELQLSQEQLKTYALQLGSDCPFFILNKPCIARGRGEMMQEINVDLSDHYFILVDTGTHVSTAWAFGQLKPVEKKVSLKDIITQPVENWRNELINDFEEPVFKQYPELEEIKKELYNAGAAYASLTGTGGCVYGIFDKKLSHVKINTLFKTYQINADH